MARAAGEFGDRDAGVRDEEQPTARLEEPHEGEARIADPEPITKAKTSAAATFALLFGFSALITAVSVFFAPVAIVFGLITLILGLVALSFTRRPGITGRGLAIGGLVMGILGLLLGVVLVIGFATFLSDPDNRAELEQFFEDARFDFQPRSNR